MAYVKDSGEYSFARPYVKEGGIYKPSLIYVKSDGSYSASAKAMLAELVEYLGGSLYLPNVSNFENTTVASGIDDTAEIDDPVAYCEDLATYNQPENMLINSVFAGAVVGAPGTMPTGWTKTVSGSGLTTEITAASASSISIRVSGTADATTTLILLRRGTRTETTAKPGEMWSASSVIGISGTLPTGKLFITAAERTAADGSVSSTNTSVVAGNLIYTRAISGASTERYDIGLSLIPAVSDVFDFTVTISNLQLERGRARDYVPTTTAAISRGTFNPAFQATTANKPLLKQTSGKWSLDFDNSNDYLQTPINPTSSGYMCVAARQDEALGASANAIFGGYKATATIQAGCALVIDTLGRPYIARVGADATTKITTSSLSTTVGSIFVADCDWTPASAKARLNGAGQGSGTDIVDVANTNTLMIIGGLNTGTTTAPTVAAGFGGAIFGVVHIPSVPSTADQATIRKLMGQIAGVSGVV